MIRAFVVAVLLAGCGGSAATPSPTAEPSSPSPTESPSPSAEESGMTWSEFRSHVRVAILDLNQQTDAIQAAQTEPLPDIGVQLAALGLLVWASDEEQWVREHLPADCYREAWSTYSEAVDLYQSAAEAFSDATDDYERALDSGTTLALEAQVTLEESGELTGNADC